MKTMTRNQLNERLGNSNNLTIVEVLSPEHYREFHLPGAINVPLDEHFDQRIQEVVPTKSSPVVVYCGSTQCQASAEAARHLDKLGYVEVYDYEAGKADWKEAGLPVEA